MAEDRDFEIFSDDLFRHILPQRLKIKCYAKQVPRKPRDPDSNWHPFMQMLISVLNIYFERHFYKYFFPQNVLEVQNRESISRYCSKYIEVLQSQSFKYCHVFDKLLLLASVTVEICAFCFLQGNREVISYAPRLYFDAFQYFKKDFFDKGGWSEWRSYTCPDTGIHGELKGTKLVGSGKWAIKSRKLIFQLCRTAIFFSMKLHEGDPRVTFLTFVSEVENSAKDIQCTFSIDCPEAKVSEVLSDQLLVIFNMIISKEKNPAYEKLTKILQDQMNVKQLLRYCYFSKLVVRIIEGHVRKNNLDILQFVNLLLKNNPRLANFCIGIMQDIHEMTEKKNLSEKHSKEGNFDSISIRSSLPENDSDVPSCEQIVSKIKGISSVHEYHKILSQFLDEIAPKDKPRSLLVLNIFQILSNEDAAIILLNSDIFRNIMVYRVNVPKDHLTDAWILSIMRYLLYCLKENSSTQMNFDKRTDEHANETNANCTLPKITEKKENTDSPTTESSLSSCHEVLTEIVEFKDQNMETTHTPVSSISSLKSTANKLVEHIDQNIGTLQSPVYSSLNLETRKTEIVENGDLNMKTIAAAISSSRETDMTENVDDDDLKVENQTPFPYESHQCYLCSHCFNHIKSKKFTIKGQNVEFFIPLKFIENMKRALEAKLKDKKKLEEKSKENASGNTCKTSVHEEHSPTTENPNKPEELNLLLDDLYLSDISESS